MRGNRKDYRWCKACRQWVFDFPLVGGWCLGCWSEWSQADKNAQQAKEAMRYLENDYAKTAI